MHLKGNKRNKDTASLEIMYLLSNAVKLTKKVVMFLLDLSLKITQTTFLSAQMEIIFRVKADGTNNASEFLTGNCID